MAIEITIDSRPDREEVIRDAREAMCSYRRCDDSQDELGGAKSPPSVLSGATLKQDLLALWDWLNAVGFPATRKHAGKSGVRRVKPRRR